jgi:Amt family ammonium transporter
MSYKVNVSYNTDSGDLLTHSYGDAVFNLGDIAWVLSSTALVWIMIPGVGFLYSGLLRRKNALSQLWLAMVGIAVVSFQWFFWGFSLTFSDGANSYIGDLSPSFFPTLFRRSPSLSLHRAFCLAKYT